MNKNMNNLFKALPRDLQWEILEEFVGTHVVRNGKLMRKMTGEIQLRLLNTMRCNYGGLYLKFKTEKYRPNYITCVDRDGIGVYTEVLLLAKYKMYVFLCTKMVNKDINMSYRYVIANQGYIVPIDNSIVLSHFKKNNYPSYPFTDKKKVLLKKKVILYNPKTSYIKN
jgi:hypothetical protein